MRAIVLTRHATGVFFGSTFGRMKEGGERFVRHGFAPSQLILRAGEGFRSFDEELSRAWAAFVEPASRFEERVTGEVEGLVKFAIPGDLVLLTGFRSDL
jgi:hypothetical protein